MRDGYVCRRTLPWLSVILLFDLLAAASLLPQVRSGLPFALKVLLAVLVIPTALFHGFLWLITALFAGG